MSLGVNDVILTLVERNPQMSIEKKACELFYAINDDFTLGR